MAAAGTAARYVTGATLVVDGGEWMYRTPLIPREAVSQASRGEPLPQRFSQLHNKEID